MPNGEAVVTGPEQSRTAGGPGGRRWRAAAAKGLFVAMVVVVLGALARLPDVTAAGLSVDQGLASGRSGVLTSVALLLTAVAQPVVGVAAMVLGSVVLALRRRRVMAVRIFGLFGVAFTGASVVKLLIAEPRPPATLAAVAADSGHSFPSGHVTVAAALCVAVWLLTARSAGGWRLLLGAAAAAFALGVGWSRLYLGVHYLPDVLGSYLVVASAALLVNAFLAFPAVRAVVARHP